MNAEEQKEHFEKVSNGYYLDVESGRSGGLISYRLDTFGTTFPTCPECRKASQAAGMTNLLCDDHSVFCRGRLTTDAEWNSLELKNGKAFVDRWKRHLHIE